MQLVFQAIGQVFPAHAGMSPMTGVLDLFDVSFPRSRGDEPAPCASAVCSLMFSPLTRG